MRTMPWVPAPAGGRSTVPLMAAPGFSRLQLVEYAFYFNIFYATVGEAVGITVNFVGLAMRILLAAVCILRLGSNIVPICRPLFGVFFLTAWCLSIQTLVHNEPMSDPFLRAFVPWIVGLVVTKSLMTRPGFLRRASIAMFAMGASLVPFLKINTTLERARIDLAGGLGHPNAIAAWFGFCAVAFTVRGFEERQTVTRWTSRGIALFCLFIVSLTVGRAALVAYSIAAAIALRKQLKRSFLPVLALGVIGFVGLASGLFDYGITRYAERATVESGRFLVWPLVVKRIIASPIVGVPTDDIATEVPNLSDPVSPHSGLLFVALCGGVVALGFFLVHWARCFQASIRPSSPNSLDAPYLLPLLIFSFLIVLQGNAEFMEPWCQLIVCACLHYRLGRSAGPSRIQNVFGATGISPGLYS